MIYGKGKMALKCNNLMVQTNRLNHSVDSKNGSDCKMINRNNNNKPITHNSNNNNSQNVTNNHSKQLISSNKCQKTMLNTVLQLTHNCRYVNTAAILLITLNILVSLSPCNAFLLDGSQNSFAQFRKWYTGLNGSLEFEFKTEQPNGLVLYTDDGGTFDFFEIKLVEGAVRLRYNLGGGANIITVGRELHDGHWHKVQIQRNDEHTTLTVDGVSQTRTSRGKEFHFGKFATNSDVFVGGMPNW
ncbi:pikachurin-like [Sitodiplosis mosellana]|uniref:pikachurin-like n=1 Tax=Sitodiplosis mosellana TaxID=263140 RepID=UPI002444C08C|nr:pikachurin-like [Sitodiplosis mosellana]XP_055322312.1 pikachurin-like [Sitodiplosis mosellana]XP_055322313.1 pikachurin-like [Sitodiplosis mosellana]